MGVNLSSLYIDETFQKLVQISGSQITDGTGSLITELDITATSASYAEEALSASHAVNSDNAYNSVTAISSSFANVSISSSYANVAGTSISSSFSDNAASASYAVTASHLLGSISSASYANYAVSAGTSVSASYALTASFALNVIDPTWDDITDKPAGLVSGSSQIDLSQATGVAASASHAEIADIALTASYAIAEDITFDDTNFAYTASNVQIALQKLSDNKADISQLTSNVITFPTTASADVAGYFALVTSSVDARYSQPSVDVPTGAITGTGHLISSLITDSYLFLGAPGIVNLITNGQIRRVSGTGTANFYYEVYARSGSTETLIATSDTTVAVSSNTYAEFSAAAVLNNGTFTEDDRIVIKYYANKLPGGSNPSYQFMFGGDAPVRTIFPVPATVLISPWNGKFTGAAEITGSLTIAGNITADNAYFMSASIGHLNTITGSVTIIGDSIIVLNNDTPTQRYAGIAVYDSGSTGVTASLEFDGLYNNWFYEYSTDMGVTTDHGVALFGPDFSIKGVPSYPTSNSIQKGTGGHHLADSIITDNGSKVTVSGQFQANGLTGSLSGNASTATTASFATLAQNLTPGDKTLDGKLSFTSGNGIDLIEKSGGGQPNYLRFYSGSTKGTNYVNIQNEPGGNGRVTVSSFPENNHFIFFDPKDHGAGNHRTYMEAVVEGGSFGGHPLLVGAGLNVTGSFNDTFPAPLYNTKYEFFTPLSASINGQAYNNVWMGMGDYGSTIFEDYFSIEYYDSTDYNFGGELNVNGVQCRFATIPSGSVGVSKEASMGTKDQGDATSLAFVRGTKIEIGNSTTTNIELEGKTVGTSNALTEVVAGATNVDFGKGNYFTLTMTGNSTLTPINIDSTNGVGQTVSVRVIAAGHTLSFASNIKWQDDVAPTLTGTSIITFVTFASDNVVYATSVNNLS